MLAPPRVATGAKVGTGAVLLADVVIGAGSLVGAGFVVTRGVESPGPTPTGADTPDQVPPGQAFNTAVNGRAASADQPNHIDHDRSRPAPADLDRSSPSRPLLARSPAA